MTFLKTEGGVKLETKINIFKKWTERFTDMHPTKPHPAPGDTCQDTWQSLSKQCPKYQNHKQIIQRIVWWSHQGRVEKILEELSILDRGREVSDNNHNCEKAFEEEIQCTGELNPDLGEHILRIKAQG